MENEDVIFQIILDSGDARTNIMSVFDSLKNKDYEQAKEYVKEANQCLNRAHKAQAAMITREINEETNSVSLLMVHAQDHLMTTMAMRDLVNKMIDLFIEA